MLRAFVLSCAESGKGLPFLPYPFPHSRRAAGTRYPSEGVVVMTKLVVVIQCEHALKRCCGFWCTRDFYDRLGPFADYPSDTQYMTFSCGGCCGQGLAAKVENLASRLQSVGRDKKNVVVHFASCVCTDNHHHTPCPFQNILKTILKRHGFTAIVRGSHLSVTAQQRRDQGIYRS